MLQDMARGCAQYMFAHEIVTDVFQVSTFPETSTSCVLWLLGLCWARLGESETCYIVVNISQVHPSQGSLQQICQCCLQPGMHVQNPVSDTCFAACKSGVVSKPLS